MTVGALSVRLGGDDAAQRRAVESLRQQGFVPAFEWQWVGGELQLWLNRERGESVTMAQTERGTACAVGPLWYRGAFGIAALERLLADAAATDSGNPGLPAMPAIDEDRLDGNFILFLETSQGRWLLNDALGFGRIYQSADRSFFSSSWLAAHAWSGVNELDAGAALEYVLIGAAHSECTPFAGASRIRLGHGVDLRTNRECPRFPGGMVATSAPPFACLDEAVKQIDERVAEHFAEICVAFPGHTSAALSGGFDSRHIVAALMACGERPRLFVYGADDDDDTRIASEIAAGENLPLSRFDKAQLTAPLSKCEVEDLIRNAWFFDGLPTDGVDDRGIDRLTRLKQSENGFIALNGGGGEIFRNYFYLPDRSFRPIDIVRTFYRGFDARAFRQAGALGAYEDRLAASIVATAGISSGRSGNGSKMNRAQVELLYPFFRCHHWTGLNNSLSLRYGNFVTPLVTLSLVRLAARVPLRWKYAGALQSRLIAARHAGLAGYPSGYGFRFSDGPDRRARRAEQMTRLRPVLLRPWFATARRALQKDRISPQRIAYWRQRLPGEWRLDPLLDLARLSNDGAFDRALSVEVVARGLTS